tara:strand:+ start:40 stop:1623 length:1584 start_codon:yes stop_codon:yes gene_type:complete
MSIYDYIIVGGGISGLFMAYKLSETGSNILLLESSGRWGGRVYTKKEKGVQFELGAARISSKHTKILSLLNELGLDKELVKLPSKINYKVNGPKINFYTLIKDVLKDSKLYTKKYLQSINLQQLCIDTLDHDGAKLLQGKLGYDSEFEFLNAHQALKSYKKDLFIPCDFFVMKSGLTSITDSLVKLLDAKDNVKLKLDCTVTDIGKNYVQIDKKKKYGSTILCCTPYQTLKQFPKFKDVSEVDAVKPIPLIRIYAKYPKDKNGKVWFHGLDRTITDNYIRHIIPIDYESGLIMISYTDGQYADMWSNLVKLGNTVLIDHLHKEIKEVLGKTPPKPEFITSYYWSAGVHMWKPGHNVNEVYEKMLQPFENEKIYVVNEAYSKHQCWMEGSLEASYDVLELLDSKFTRGKPKKKKVKGGSKESQNNKRQNNKIYTIQQVLKKRNWIVLDIKGKLRIYDVSKWLKDHPGGAANLKKGIKANKHYVNKDKYPDSPIKLFKEIGSHMSSRVIQKMLLKDNDKVKFIGILKKV